MDISNGEGIGVALFVQGCHFHCKNCFNPETWDFQGGKDWTPQTEELFLTLASRPQIKRISILGGEPLAEENIETICDLVQRIHKEFGNTKKIWLYTGYTYEALSASAKERLLPYIDIMVDGQYDETLKDMSYQWAGSTNQRIIDVQASLSSGCVEPYGI